jgi:hypothetical protein
LDGDRSQTLHPGGSKAESGSAVEGPDVFSYVEGFMWQVDGRPRVAEKPQITDGETGYCEVDTPYTGVPGDRYRIELAILGKWRTVTWEKLEGKATTPPLSKYSVTSSANDWGLEDMDVDDAAAGKYSHEVCLMGSGTAFFQIVRSKDYEQVLYPVEPDNSKIRAENTVATVEKTGGNRPGDAVQGPDEFHESQCWRINGLVGDVYRIEFERKFDNGEDKKKISWKHIGTRTAEEERTRQKALLEKRAEGRRAQEEREAAELEARLG